MGIGVGDRVRFRHISSGDIAEFNVLTVSDDYFHGQETLIPRDSKWFIETVEKAWPKTGTFIKGTDIYGNKFVGVTRGGFVSGSWIITDPGEPVANVASKETIDTWEVV